MAIFKRQVASSPIFVSFFSFIKYYSSVIFLTQTIYTLLKRIPLKWKFLRFGFAWVKFCQVPYANFETSCLLCIFCIFLQFHKRLFLCNFLRSNNRYFAQKQPVKRKNFWDFGMLRSNFVKFLMPILKQQLTFSQDYVSLLSFMEDYSSSVF